MLVSILRNAKIESLQEFTFYQRRCLIMATKETIKSRVSEKYNYDVLIEYQEDGLVSAKVLGCSDAQVTADSKEEALKQLQQLLTTGWENKEIVSLEVKKPQKEHPWLKFAGMYDNNPLMNEFFAEIEANRQQTENDDLQIIEV
jgi:predicted RNase H-like HicB family nuclease